LVGLLVSAAGCAPAGLQPTAATAATAQPQPSAAPEEHSLIVFAAASLTDAFTEIESSFEAANPGVTVKFNFAGSQALRTQIEEGAAADVFASANTKEMEALAGGGKLAGEAGPFVNNVLVIIAPADNPAGLATPQDLARPGLKLVLAAEEVPVGKYARQALGQLETLYGAGYRDSVLANVVSNEDNVKQVVAKVRLGEADAGIVYQSDVVAAPELTTIEIPAEANVVAVYPITVLRESAEPVLAQDFIDYVLSDAGQATLLKWGFRSPMP
jgi:molybdate transport system substrate-binding protein